MNKKEYQIQAIYQAAEMIREEECHPDSDDAKEWHEAYSRAAILIEKFADRLTKRIYKRRLNNANKMVDKMVDKIFSR